MTRTPQALGHNRGTWKSTVSTAHPRPGLCGCL